ncbi:MAG: hypothetical protein A3D31_00650 [Candidatus Fluviicola riflensis]|nr:MAG: hypothetical protein A3D31_00650 [Candidatus Fluviicola riflensis]OGS82017.1 MAG: hypothetical protein A2724_16405 [Fluviicola sp. RIFCSPHIGHO2_01_FULL_43_53]OGS83476.1 MAG: hypothetical protein A3E30_16810 [Fluviicola sp. RIFCSPHIGHO2_12_FULL_43_24]
METFEEVEPQKKRPVFLTVLGILTFINSGFGLLGALMSYLAGPASSDEIEDYLALNMKNIEQIRGEGMDGFADTMEKMINSIQYSNDAHFLSTTLNLAISALAIAGVIMMFRGQKAGFHLYIIGCLLRISSFYFYTPAAEVSGMMVGYFTFTSLLFIFMYSRNLKWLK